MGEGDEVPEWEGACVERDGGWIGVEDEAVVNGRGVGA